MTVRRKIAGLCAAAMLSLALAPPALAAPAGDEYLPKVPQSGTHSSGSGGSSASAGTATTTLPTGGTSSPTTSDTKNSGTKNSGSDGSDKNKKDNTEQITPIGSSGSGGSGGGDSSGSIIFNPIVLLMIAAVIAVAVGMTLRRRSVDEGDPESPGGPGPSGRREASPRTPDGEIATGRDRIA
jgi:cobalamin biosynthesis Mg chelatase CobN